MALDWVIKGSGGEEFQQEIWDIGEVVRLLEVIWQNLMEMGAGLLDLMGRNMVQPDLMGVDVVGGD